MSPCEEFDAGVDELSLGLLDEPERSRLLAHASTCPACQARLEELASVVDRLVLLTPEVEPPAGFESRALARMGPPASAEEHHGRRWLALVVAAVVVALLGVAAFTAGRASSPTPVATGRQAPIVTPSGTTVGEARLLATPTPHILVTVDQPRPGPGARSCVLVRPDGTVVTVGSWTYDEIETGVWAVGIDPSLLDASTMRVVDADGTVLATATF